MEGDSINISSDVAKVIALALKLAGGDRPVSPSAWARTTRPSFLRRFGRPPHLCNIAEQAIRGEAVPCVGASEQSGGSDLQIVGTEVRSVRDGFEVKGIKKFVSLSPIADHVMAVARNVDHDPNSKHGSVVVIAVPLAQCRFSSHTARSAPDRWTPPPCTSTPGCPPSAGRAAGIGLAAISWGLAQERMSVAGLCRHLPSV